MIIHEFTFLMMKEKSILNMHPKQRTTRKIPVNNNRCHGPEKNRTCHTFYTIESSCLTCGDCV